MSLDKRREHDLRFMNDAIDEAEKSRFERSGKKPEPKVGAVVVRNGRILATGHWGERRGNHAEEVIIKKLKGKGLAEAVIYTTLEPCTRRSTRTPCTHLIIDSGIRRVVIGAYDPNPEVSAYSLFLLSSNNVKAEVLYDSDDRLRNRLDSLYGGFRKSYASQQISLARVPTPDRLHSAQEDHSPAAYVAIEQSQLKTPLYVSLIRPVLNWLKIRVSNIGATNHNESIRSIDQSHIVIGVLPGAGPDVFYDLGYAIKMGKEVFLLTDKHHRIPNRLLGMPSLACNMAQPGLSANDFSQRLRKTLAYEDFSLSKPLPKILNRGEVCGTVIDAAIYFGKAPLFSKEEVISCLEHQRVVPQKYLYLTDEGHDAYMAMCGDISYGYYRHTTDFVANHADAIVAKIREFLGTKSFDFISLGPGNGQKDAMLLSSMVRGLRSESIYYYPFDVSAHMLSDVVRVLHDQRLTEKVLVKAILSEFKHIADFQSVFDFRKGQKVFAMLGNTLGNMDDETDLLKQLHSMMRVDDLLLLEVRIIQGRRLSVEDSSDTGRDDLNKMFDLTPLHYVSGARCDAGDVVYRFVTGQSKIPKTRTKAGYYPGFPLAAGNRVDALLSLIHYYDAGELRRSLRNTGLEIAKEYVQPGSIFLLTKRSKEGKDQATREALRAA